MADFAPNWTPRYRVQYRVLSQKHNMQFRVIRGTPKSSAGSVAVEVATFLDAFRNMRFSDFSILGADWAQEDSDIFTPVTAPPALPSSVSLAGVSPSMRALQMGFVGRSDAGGRARLFVYGVAMGVTDAASGDFRVNPTENTQIDAAISALNSTAPQLVANDGYDVTWYPYANVKYNDYYVKKLRG